MEEKSYFTISVRRHPGSSSQKVLLHRSLIEEPQWEGLSWFCSGPSETSGKITVTHEKQRTMDSWPFVCCMLLGGARHLLLSVCGGCGVFISCFYSNLSFFASF